MRVHFIGLGEVNLFNLAAALHKKGETVTGSDEVFDESLKTMMEQQGLLSDGEGWFSNKIHAQLDAVVVGLKVKKDNPELIKAQELGLTIFSSRTNQESRNSPVNSGRSASRPSSGGML